MNGRDRVAKSLYHYMVRVHRHPPTEDAGKGNNCRHCSLAVSFFLYQSFTAMDDVDLAGGGEFFKQRSLMDQRGVYWSSQVVFGNDRLFSRVQK